MAVWEISNLRYVTSQPAVFWRAFIDFRRPFEKGYFWAAVYYIDAAFGLLINFMMAIVRIFHYYSILGGLNWRNNHCTKYFHYLLMFPISWIIDIDSASVSSTHTALIHRAIK